MASLAIKAGKGGHMNVPTPPQHGSFVLGSRPPGVRTPPVARIRPALSQRDYAKADNPAGNTGQTSLS